MSFKDDVKRKVPERLKITPEFKTFLQILSKKRFANARALRMFLDEEIAHCKGIINTNKRTPSGNTERRKCTRHLQLYTTIKQKILPYL